MKSKIDQKLTSLNFSKMLNKSRIPKKIDCRNNNYEPYHSVINWIEINKKQSLDKKYINNKKSFSLQNRSFKPAKNIQINFINPKMTRARIVKKKQRCNSVDTSCTFSQRNPKSASNSFLLKHQQAGHKFMRNSLTQFLQGTITTKKVKQAKGLKIHFNQSLNSRIDFDSQQLLVKGSKII